MTTPRLTPYVPIVPTPKQSAFLVLDDVREVFYGGAAGPGKTSALLAAALQYVDVPGYSALLLRRNYKQLSLPGSLIPVSKTWLGGTGASYHEGHKTWTFPSGATLTFGFVSNERDDERKYETAEFQFIGIDELTSWPEEQYRFLFSRLRRREGMPIPIRMRSASNPGGRGHTWVKRRFVDHTTRNERAVFIRALLDDNPHLDREEYVQTLQELHPTHWRRILHGDWDAADPGEMFQPRLWLDDDDYLDAAPTSGVVARVRYWDLAAAEPGEANPDPDYTVGARFSMTRDGLYVMEHLVRVRQTPARTEDLVRQTTQADGVRCAQWIEQVPGAGKALVDHYRRNVCPDDYVMRGNPVVGSKGMRARPLAAAMEKHRVKVVRGPWNDPLWDEMEAFSEDPQHSGAHDDQVDACAGAYAKVKPQGRSLSATPAGRDVVRATA